MSESIVIHGFETSNNMKVRVALGYKDIPYEFRTIEPAEREDIIRISGQHLTPVLTHGSTVMFDSAAILRYLDANFPDTPRLFGSSHAEQWEIEDWELFARAGLAGPMMQVVHARVSGEPLDETSMEACGESLAESVAMLVAQLGGREWLVGDSMSAADITAGAVVHRVRNGHVLAALRKREERLQKLSLLPSEFAKRQVRATPYPTEDVGWIIRESGDDMCLFS